MTNLRKQNKGITLVELVITMGISGVLMASALPNFKESIRNNRMVTQINELQGSLRLARSEAIKRNDNITICRSSSGSSCTGDWKDGWIVFVDSNFNGSVDEEEVLRVHGALAESNTLKFNQPRVIYNRDGLTRDNANGTFTLCDESGAMNAKQITIGATGRAGMATDVYPTEVPPDSTPGSTPDGELDINLYPDLEPEPEPEPESICS